MGKARANEEEVLVKTRLISHSTTANAAESWWAEGVAKRGGGCHLSLPDVGLSPLIKIP